MKKPRSRAAAATKRAHRYLTPITDAAGDTIGYRFAPGPHLRASGAASKVLRRHDNTLMSLDEAKAYRDAAIGAPAATPQIAGERRTLDALWLRFVVQRQKEIDAGDEDAIGGETLRIYKSQIKPWLTFGGDELAAALTGEIIIEEYKQQRKTASHAACTIRRAALSAVLTYGVRIGWLAANPALRLGLSAPKGRLRLISPEEAAALVSAADALGKSVIGDGLVAGLWTGQREGDLLDCDLGKQLKEGCLVFARIYEGDFSQEKTGGHAHVMVLAPLAERLRGRQIGRLIPGRNGARYNSATFREHFALVRAKAAEAVPSCATLQFRDARDTSVTRLFEALISAGRRAADVKTQIGQWTGHSAASIDDILEQHYLVATRHVAEETAEALDAWRARRGVVY